MKRMLCKAVERLVSLMGGWDKFVRPGEKILLKPNLLMKSAEEAVTTHPAVAGRLPGASGEQEVMLLLGIALVDP